MRIVTNHKKIRQNRRIAQYAFFGTLALLILGLFVTNAAPSNPVLLLAPLVVLPVAIAATFYSVRMANLWLREPRPEKILEESLKGMSTRAVLYNYALPARHVLIMPQGVFTFTFRPQDGTFTIDGNQWRKQTNALGRFMTIFRQDSIGRPDLEAQREAASVQEVLDKAVPDNNITVEPVVVFSSDAAIFEVINAEMPIIYGASKQKPNIKTFGRDMKKREEVISLTDEQIEALEETLGLSAEALA